MDSEAVAREERPTASGDFPTGFLVALLICVLFTCICICICAWPRGRVQTNKRGSGVEKSQDDRDDTEAQIVTDGEGCSALLPSQVATNDERRKGRRIPFRRQEDFIRLEKCLSGIKLFKTLGEEELRCFYCCKARRRETPSGPWK